MDCAPIASWYSFQRWPSRIGFVLGSGVSWNSMRPVSGGADAKRAARTGDGRELLGLEELLGDLLALGLVLPLDVAAPAGALLGEELAERDPAEVVFVDGLGHGRRWEAGDGEVRLAGYMYRS
jgi:hypothetical protein